MESSAATAARAQATLRWVPKPELDRIRGLDADPHARAAAWADALRINVLHMVMNAGSGHLGTSFSCLDLLSWLHLGVLRDGDRCYSSKGHDAPAVYAVLAGLGAVEFDQIHALRRLGGLPGHPDVHAVPAVHTNTGSLGMGISKARGFLHADRLLGRDGRVFVICGDGELQEGQFWESLQPTANQGVDGLTVVVDHNKIQSDTWVDQVSDVGDLERKIGAFGWTVERCDGHDLVAFDAALQRLDAAAAPGLVIADTLKGAGVSFMEPHDLAREGDSLYGYHSGAPTPEEYERAFAELAERLGRRLEDLGAEPVSFEETAAPRRVPPERPQRLVDAYGDALVEAAQADARVVALDADLRLDTGLVAFRKRFPDRFFECGIAEQDMVSQAGTMALGGLVPAVHSFACFLAPRANEQIFNNATEGTKVLYAGSLAGIVPGGPGHSHQSVRDIALFGCVPGMALLEPATEHECRLAVRWAVTEAPGPVYIRLVSVPWELGFDPPAPERLEPGRGTVVREGSDAMLVTTGPVLLSQAHAA
jgi:transketolase